MKKLLAWLMSFFIALGNNVEYTRQEDTHDYNETEIYYFDTQRSGYDYRNSQEQLSMSSSAVSCRFTRYASSKAKRVKYDSNNAPEIEAYWFEAGQVVDIADIPSDTKEYVFTTSGEIVAPYACKLTTENLSANDCTTMELVCTIHNTDTYRITITGMERWYCDVRRQELVFHTWDNPSENGDYKQFQAGDCLGISVSGQTKIVVNPMSGGTVDNRSLTVQDFFLQK